MHIVPFHEFHLPKTTGIELAIHICTLVSNRNGGGSKVSHLGMVQKVMSSMMILIRLTATALFLTISDLRSSLTFEWKVYQVGKVFVEGH